MYKLKNDLLPVAVANHFEVRNTVPTHNYDLRNRGTTPQIDTHLESSEKSIQIRGAKNLDGITRKPQKLNVNE